LKETQHSIESADDSNRKNEFNQLDEQVNLMERRVALNRKKEGNQS